MAPRSKAMETADENFIWDRDEKKAFIISRPSSITVGLLMGTRSVCGSAVDARRVLLSLMRLNHMIADPAILPTAFIEKQNQYWKLELRQAQQRGEKTEDFLTRLIDCGVPGWVNEDEGDEDGPEDRSDGMNEIEDEEGVMGTIHCERFTLVDEGFDLKRVVMNDGRTWPKAIKERAKELMSNKWGEEMEKFYPVEVRMMCEMWKRKLARKRVRVRVTKTRGVGVNECAAGCKGSRTARRLAFTLKTVENDFAMQSEELAVLKERVGEDGVTEGKVNLWDSTRRCFSSRTRSLIMCLKAAGVSDEKVPRVIRTFGDFFYVRYDRVPCKSTVGNIAFQARKVALKHAGVLMKKAKDQLAPLCVLSDETSKFQQKLQGYIMSYEDGHSGEQKLVHLGVAEVASKASLEQMEKLKRVLEDIGEGWAEELALQVTACMGDRATTQTRFAELLEEFKREVMARRDSWDGWSEEAKKSLSQFGSFSCLLHGMDNLTGVVLEGLARHEEGVKGLRSGTVGNTDPSVNSCLVDMGMLFGVRGAAKKQLRDKLEKFCADENREWVSIPSFKGNRWNIVFVIANRVLRMKETVLRFMEWHGTDADSEKVNVYLNDEMIVAHLTLLAVYNHKVTRVLWRCAEKKGARVSDTQGYIAEMLEFVQQCEIDPSHFYSDYTPCADFLDDVGKGKENEEREEGSERDEEEGSERDEEEGSERDEVGGSERDEEGGEGGSERDWNGDEEEAKDKASVAGVKMTDQLREATVGVMKLTAAYIKRVHVDYLPGGKFFGEQGTGNFASQDDQGLGDWARCVPTTNRALESLFGLWDQQMRFAPLMRNERTEAVCLFLKNGTVEWLASLSPQELESIMYEAMDSFRLDERVSEERRQEVWERKALKYKGEVDKRKEASTRLAARNAGIVSRVLDVGLVTTRAALKVILDGCNTEGGKRGRVIDQLRLRQHVFGQPAGDSSYAVTHKGKPLSLDTLCNNLLKLAASDKEGMTVCDELDSKLREKKCTVIYSDVDEKRRIRQDTTYSGTITGVMVHGKGGEPILDMTYELYEMPFVMSYGEYLLKTGNGSMKVFEDEDDLPLFWGKTITKTVKLDKEGKEVQNGNGVGDVSDISGDEEGESEDEMEE